MMKAAILLRVSKDDGTQDTENQLHDCQELAARRGYEVPEEYIIREEVSGAKLRGARPGLDKAAELAHRGKIAALIVWKLDRFSRNDTLLGGVMMLGEFNEQYNVPVISYSESYLDMAGPFRHALCTLALRLAAEYRESVIENTNRALQRVKREIGQKGGFRVTGKRSKRKGQWIRRLGRPDGLDDATMAKLRELHKEGLSPYLAAKRLELPETTVRRRYARFEAVPGPRQPFGPFANPPKSSPSAGRANGRGGKGQG